MKTEISLVAQQVNHYLEKNRLNHISPEYLAKSAFYLIQNGGKRIRPALMIWFAQLYGSTTEKVLPVASAGEVFHTWTLVHDDIIDKDETRRGKPATHTFLKDYAVKQFGNDNDFGVNMGILTGDLQQAWVNKLVLNSLQTGCRPETVLAVLNRINNCLTPLLINGEATDVEFESRAPVNIQEVIDMMKHKTSILLEFCAQTGVVIAGDLDCYESKEVVNAGIFARNCGLAFQLQDDILGVFAEENRLGKPVGSDLCAGKQTVMILKTAELAATDDLAFIKGLKGQSCLNKSQLKKARDIIAGCGALKAVEKLAQSFSEAALEALKQCPENKYRTYLNTFCHYMTDRRH